MQALNGLNNRTLPIVYRNIDHLNIFSNNGSDNLLIDSTHEQVPYTNHLMSLYQRVVRPVSATFCFPALFLSSFSSELAVYSSVCRMYRMRLMSAKMGLERDLR